MLHHAWEGCDTASATHMQGSNIYLSIKKSPFTHFILFFSDGVHNIAVCFRCSLNTIFISIGKTKIEYYT